MYVYTYIPSLCLFPFVSGSRRLTSGALFVYYEEIKRELKRILIHEYRCNERLKAKTEGSTRLAYTKVLRATGELKRAEHLKNVFAFHFFENLFLGSLLGLLAQFVMRKKQHVEEFPEKEESF
jgi:hypothetical protein